MATCDAESLLASAAASEFTELSTRDALSVILQLLCNASQVPVEQQSGSATLDASQCYGSIIYVTGAGTITLPPVQEGMSVTIITVGAIAVSVNPDDSDLILLDGTALDDGDQIDNTSTAGDAAVLTYYDSTGWYATTNSWTDGG